MTSQFYYTHSVNGAGSTAIRKIYYDKVSQNLYVFFPNRDRPAGYTGVSEDEFISFGGAYSLGSYYAQYIRNNPRVKGCNTSDITEENLVLREEEPADEKVGEVFEVVFEATITVRIAAKGFDDAAQQVKEGNPSAVVKSVTRVE